MFCAISEILSETLRVFSSLCCITSVYQCAREMKTIQLLVNRKDDDLRKMELAGNAAFLYVLFFVVLIRSDISPSLGAPHSRRRRQLRLGRGRRSAQASRRRRGRRRRARRGSIGGLHRLVDDSASGSSSSLVGLLLLDDALRVGAFPSRAAPIAMQQRRGSSSEGARSSSGDGLSRSGGGGSSTRRFRRRFRRRRGSGSWSSDPERRRRSRRHCRAASSSTSTSRSSVIHSISGSDERGGGQGLHGRRCLGGHPARRRRDMRFQGCERRELRGRGAPGPGRSEGQGGGSEPPEPRLVEGIKLGRGEDGRRGGYSGEQGGGVRRTLRRCRVCVRPQDAAQDERRRCRGRGRGEGGVAEGGRV